MKKAWFANWFDTEYYHQLYGKKRNENEATIFINNLLAEIKLPLSAKAWDMCCGKGRHVRALNDNGINTIGTDLSKTAISFANNYASINMQFAVHDMRHFYMSNYFDLVGNFFTSIGYFKNDCQDLKIVKNAFVALNKDGYFVLDFLNSKKLIDFKDTLELKEINGVKYEIKKYIINNTIYKEIKVNDGDLELYHKEQVRLYTNIELSSMAILAGFKEINLYGNYNLEPFEINSERCILIAKK